MEEQGKVSVSIGVAGLIVNEIFVSPQLAERFKRFNVLEVGVLIRIFNELSPHDRELLERFCEGGTA